MSIEFGVLMPQIKQHKYQQFTDWVDWWNYIVRVQFVYYQPQKRMRGLDCCPQVQMHAHLFTLCCKRAIRPIQIRAYYLTWINDVTIVWHAFHVHWNHGYFTLTFFVLLFFRISLFLEYYTKVDPEYLMVAHFNAQEITQIDWKDNE